MEENQVVVLERIAAQPMRREAREHAAVPFARAFDGAEDVELIFLVSDSESRLEQDVGAQLTEQLGAEGVDGAALDALGAVSSPVGQLADG